MSELFTHTSASSRDHLPPLRVAVIIPNEGIVFSPHPKRAELFSDPMDIDPTETKRPPSIEKRATRIGSRLPRYNLSAMSALDHLGTIEGVQGFAVRPAASVHLETMKSDFLYEFNIDDVLKNVEQDASCIDDIDLMFLKRAFRNRLNHR